MRGYCRNGEDCRFYHPEERSQRNSFNPRRPQSVIRGRSSQPPQSQQQSRSSQQISNQQNRSSQPSRPRYGRPNQQNRKNVYTKICKYYRQGYCREGSRCTFIHEQRYGQRNYQNDYDDEADDYVEEAEQYGHQEEFHNHDYEEGQEYYYYDENHESNANREEQQGIYGSWYDDVRREEQDEDKEEYTEVQTRRPRNNSQPERYPTYHQTQQ